MSFGVESSSWGIQFEGPDEVIGFLEVGSDSVDFVDQILDTDDILLLSEGLFDDGVAGERDSLSLDLSKSSFVDESANGGLGRISK